MTDSRRITYVWAALSVVTIVTWLLAHTAADPGGTAAAVVTIAVLGIAFTKAHLIIWYFMDVRSAPRWLRYFAGVWVVVLAGIVLAGFLW